MRTRSARKSIRKRKTTFLFDMPKAAPHSPTPPQRLDHNDISALTTALLLASDELAAMTEAVAKARVVREFSGDRRKRALALSVREFLKDDTATASETKGRASELYGEALNAQAKELTEAERVVAAHDAARVRWESIRSALSCLKAVTGNQ